MDYSNILTSAGECVDPTTHSSDVIIIKSPVSKKCKNVCAPNVLLDDATDVLDSCIGHLIAIKKYWSQFGFLDKQCNFGHTDFSKMIIERINTKMQENPDVCEWSGGEFEDYE
jgi:hypothetical protein